MRASSGCLTADGYLVKGPTLVAKNATRMGHPRETSFVENYRDQMIRNIVPSGAKVWEKSVVPLGLESFVPFFPALPRWAKLGRPCGAGFSGISSLQLGWKLSIRGCSGMATVCSTRVPRANEGVAKSASERSYPKSPVMPVRIPSGW